MPAIVREHASSCGNGGSAADAQHFAAELTGHLIFDRPPLGAEALHANSSHLTAVANDYDYDTVLPGPSKDLRVPATRFCDKYLRQFYECTAGRETARELGVTVVAMTGESGGQLAEFADFLINVPSRDTGRIQESHIVFIHAISEHVEHALSRLANRKADPYAAIRKMVAERAGHQWCLFLDRDGVINRQVVGDYVRNWRQFEWLPGRRGR